MKGQVCTPTVMASSSNICSGDSVTLSASGATNYTWMPSGEFTNIVTEKPLSTTIYTLFASTGACTSSVTIQISVSLPPSVSVSAFNNSICAGSTTSLSANGATSYYWSPAYSVSDSLASFVVASPSISTTYTVVGYNGVCQSSAYITLNVIPSPVLSFSIQADATPHVWNIYPTCSGGALPYTYSWDWGDGSNSNIQYPSHTYSVAGTYNIVLNVTDANGCNGVYSTSANLFKTANNNQVSTIIQVNVINNLTTGIQTIQNNTAISVFPNPTSEKVYINMPTSERELVLEIFDLNGKLVMNKKINFSSYIDVSSLNNGLYTLTIKAENSLVNKRLTIVR